MSKIFSNVFWLMISQIGGILITLIEQPLLARRLGANEYGKVVYVLAIAIIASVFIEYGFNFSAVKKITGKKNKKYISQVSTDVFFAKLILSIIPIILAFFLIYVTPSDISIPYSWFFWVFLFILSFGFTPLWYYISMERIIFPTILDFSLRIIELVLIVVFIRTSNDAETTIFIQSMVGMLNTSITTFFLFYMSGVGSFNIKKALNEIKSGFSVFLYKSSQGIMITMSSLLLGFFGGGKSVGYFVPSEKITKVMTTLITTILNIAYPKFVKSLGDIKNNKDRIKIKIKIVKYSLVLSILSLVFSVVVFIFSKKIIFLVFGEGYENAIPLINAIIWIIPLRAWIMSLIILWFIPTNKENFVTKITFINIILISITAYLFIFRFGTMGIVMSILLSELITFLVLTYFFFKKTNLDG
ncbi:oligosaccharide flippase family protein (plasmid) [Arsenophonus nasoniae]|uniref:O-antigen transporter n=1 Tax=Arsenophonus nasoniae TaxID=638 RepID=A0A4P7KZE2_9GAMM|nr:oligosaccharide flippase family protein [Arsenophonus nasoniae]QBY45767.1 Putative O-antigen transporter [Arsenophonus nasoniae]WGM08020.1 oligosaccharide flippase family protein [Arsenophonus nasoniae]WGM12838.1 oligosaccharide flippase family protein [Arsenophonus nasoniae]WGM17546.1 oligosaccharide flippase family protein [Arsenophonus nasoniae]